MISQTELKVLVDYSQSTGLFTRLIKTSSRVKVGDIAGYVHKINGYRYIRAEGKSYRAHRLAWFYMTGEWPKEIDHINHIKTDNRWENLREVTHQENGKNRSKSKNNTSGVTGVSRSKQTSKWAAHIRINGKLRCLGSFTDKFEAICCRKSAENKHGFHPNHGRPKQASIILGTH